MACSEGSLSTIVSRIKTAYPSHAISLLPSSEVLTNAPHTHLTHTSHTHLSHTSLTHTSHTHSLSFLYVETSRVGVERYAASVCGGMW